MSQECMNYNYNISNKQNSLRKKIACQLHDDFTLLKQ